jgi:hypothetical protein
VNVATASETKFANVALEFFGGGIYACPLSAVLRKLALEVGATASNADASQVGNNPECIAECASVYGLNEGKGIAARTAAMTLPQSLSECDCSRAVPAA